MTVALTLAPLALAPLALAPPLPAAATTGCISTAPPEPGRFPLVAGGRTAPIVVGRGK